MDFLSDIRLYDQRLLVIGGVVSFFVQLVFPAIWRCVWFGWRYMTDKSKLVGDWHAYHCTYRNNKPTIIKSLVTIKKAFKTSYTAILKQDDESKLIYRGTVTLEKHHIVCSFRSLNHAENVVIRFPDPLGANKCYGIWLSYDHDQNVASGGICLSRAPLNNVDLLSEITHGFELLRGRPQLRVINKIK